MHISCQHIGKKFNREWIFKGLDLEIPSGQKLLIKGGNGSGKSTLLKCISGYYSLSKGDINYKSGEQAIKKEDVYKQISISAPYSDIYEELNLKELVNFHRKFVPFKTPVADRELEAVFQLEKVGNKLIKNFSSGMKQRVKTGLAILSDTPLLLLDEPLSNMDAKGADWYQSMIRAYAQERTVIVCSNSQEEESSFCTEAINVEDFKGG